MRRPWAYSITLALILISAFILIRSGVVQSITQPGDVSISSASSSYTSGEKIRLNASLDFANGEVATTTSVILNISGPQSINIAVPMEDGKHDLSSHIGVSGSLTIDVDFHEVAALSSQIVGVFKGIGQGASIQITADWTPDSAVNSAGNYAADLIVEVADLSGSAFSDQERFSIREVTSSVASSNSGSSSSRGRRAVPPTSTPSPTETATPTPTFTPTQIPTATLTPTPDLVRIAINRIQQNQLSALQASEVLRELNSEDAADAITVLDVARASEIVSLLAPNDSSEILSKVSTIKAAEILENLSENHLHEYIRGANEDRVINILSTISDKMLRDVPNEMKVENLANIPTEQLYDENPPQLSEDDTHPDVLDSSTNLSVYRVANIAQEEWTQLVASPAPLEAVMGRFHQPLTEVKIWVQNFSRIPLGAPSLDIGQEVYAVFKLSLQNAEPKDLDIAHMTFFVEKSWMADNDIQKWSIQLQLLDESTNLWSAYPTKLISEDDERIVYTTVIPEFSTFTITGSRSLPTPVFSVTNLIVEPTSVNQNETLSIKAEVENLSDKTSLYPGYLWIDNSIQQVNPMWLGVEQAKTVSFSVRGMKPGIHNVRVERLLDEFTVTQPETMESSRFEKIETPTHPPALAPLPTNTAFPMAEAIQPTQTPRASATLSSIKATPMVTPDATSQPSPTPHILTLALAPMMSPTPTQFIPSTELQNDVGEEGGIGNIIGFMLLGIGVLAGITAVSLGVLQRRRSSQDRRANIA